MIAAIVLAAAVHLPPPVSGDFDQDGRPDIAKIVPGPRGSYRLVLISGDKRRPIVTIDTFNAAELANLYLTKEKPTRLKTWCGKGGGSDDDPCPYKSVRLKGETLAYGEQEASEWIAYWTGRKFVRVLISD